MTDTKSAISRVAGFRAVGVTCGLKESGQPDLALILADRPCRTAAVFTTNAFKAAPLLYDMGLLERTGGQTRGVVINAGIANAITGGHGFHDAERMARLSEAACDLPEDAIFVMSTGVIGQRLPMTKIERGVQLAAEAIQGEAGAQGQDAARAIMTTDTVPKEAFAGTTLDGQPIHIGGIAKGSGMIHPNMATMLAVIVTDANLGPAALDAALRRAVSRTFNRITVDGDTSPNDTVCLLANGQAGPPIADVESTWFEPFTTALTGVCSELAQAIVRDGEGATKLIEITIRGAASEAQAEAAAKTVATSPLVKTAIFGCDPNWGRVLAAIGRSGAELNVTQVSLWLADFQVVAWGEPLEFDAVAAHNWLAEQKEIRLVADLGMGQAEATVWTCDLSYDYVKINAEYHT